MATRHRLRSSLVVKRFTPPSVLHSSNLKITFVRLNRLTSKRKKKTYEASESSHRCGAQEKGQARRRASRRVVEDCLCRLYDGDDGILPGDVAYLHLQPEGAGADC